MSELATEYSAYKRRVTNKSLKSVKSNENIKLENDEKKDVSLASSQAAGNMATPPIAVEVLLQSQTSTASITSSLIEENIKHKVEEDQDCSVKRSKMDLLNIVE